MKPVEAIDTDNLSDDLGFQPRQKLAIRCRSPHRALHPGHRSKLDEQRSQEFAPAAHPLFVCLCDFEHRSSVFLVGLSRRDQAVAAGKRITWALDFDESRLAKPLAMFPLGVSFTGVKAVDEIQIKPHRLRW